jgi:hypothetical protein
MTRSPFRPRAPQVSTEVLESSQLDRLLDQLVMVFQGVLGEPSSATARPFAAGLPRYEFKTKSIFPEAGKTTPESDSTPVRAHAQLRTFLNDAADQSSPSRTWALAACLRMLEARVGSSLAVRALPAMAGAARGEPRATLTELREALERVLQAELGASSRPAR